jgi:hypothetical protein
MALFNNEGLRFPDREKVFEKRNVKTVRIDGLAGGTHQKSCLVQIHLTCSHKPIIKVPDRTFQNLDWERENQLLPQYNNRRKLKT